MSTPARSRSSVPAVVAALVAGLLAAALPLGGAAVARVVPGPGGSGYGDGYFPLDGNGGIDVLRYRIRDKYRFASGRLSGSTTLTVRATEDLSRFNLDLLLPATAVTVDGVAADFGKPDEEKHELRITPAHPIPHGRSFEVRVEYDGQPGPIEYAGERNWLANDHEVVAMNQPHMAPWWFASNDHPGDKALMDIAITVHRDKQVVANGQKVGRTGDGTWRTTRWRAAEPMATYLAFFAAGDWHVVKGERADGLPWRAVVSRQLGDAQERASLHLMKQTPGVIADLEEDLGPYPFATSGGLTTSLGVGFALENQTMPTYPVLGTNGLTIVVHEQAHQWFGDSVALRRWRDIWLNEGAATFMEKRYNETHGGQSAQAWMRNAYDDMSSGDSFWDLEIGDPGPNRIFAEPVYDRGGMLLQALRNRVGEDDFWTTLRRWVSEREGGHGTTPEFRALAEEVSGADLAGFFDAWLSPGKPADTAANGLG